jgi:hypothetical protein
MSMRIMTVLMLAQLTSGCIITDDRAIRYYTQADIDAINAEIACRRLARNLLQVEQCSVRR